MQKGKSNNLNMHTMILSSILSSLVLGIFLLTCALPALAQQGTAVLRGTVTDPNGAVIAGAQVAIVNQATGLNRRTVTTSNAGEYVFPALIPGPYRITVEATGFKTAVRENINLEVGQTQSLTLLLEVGATEETITVTAELPIVSTTEKEIGGHLEERELVELPSINRNFIGFIGLLPGVVANISTESFGSDSISVNGQDPRYNNFLLDGANNNDDVIGQRAGAQTRTALESVAEFQVITNQFDAEFGRSSGGIINAITKSGTNQFHGSGFGFFQDSSLDSANRFVDLNNLQEPEADMQQWGFTVGGPIKKDLAQGFFSFERTTISDGVVINIPSRPELNDTTSENTRATNTTLRFDAQPADNHQLSWRWLRENSPQFNQIINRFGRPVTLSASREEADTDQTFVGSWIASLTPTFLNDLRISFTRENVAFANPNFNSGTPQDQLLPTLVFSSFVTQQNDIAQGRINNSYRAADTMTWTRGGHSVKFGFDYNYVTADTFNQTGLNGRFFFPTDQDFNANDPTTFPERLVIRVGGPLDFVLVNHNYSLFFQDSWKVNRKLTLHLGARFDDETISSDNNNFSPRLGFAYDPLGDGKTVIRGGFGIFYNVTPEEVIFAFRTAGPFSSSFIRNFPLDSADPGPRNGQFPTDPTLVNGPTVDRNAIASVIGDSPIISNPAPFVDNSDRQMPSVRTFTIGVQREMVPNLALSADFVHQDGEDQFVTASLNAGIRQDTASTAPIDRRFATLGEVIQNNFVPVDTSLFSNFPFQDLGISNVRTRINAGSTDYNALQLALNKRFSQGFQFKLSYTLADGDGNVSGSAFGAANFQRLDDLRLDANQGPTDFDRRHNFSFSGVWEVPRTRGLMISTIFRALSGQALTIQDSRVDADQNGINFDPLPPGPFTGSRTFPNGETLTFNFDNDGGRNGARGPDFFSWDLRFAYKYKFTETINGGFTFEIFNLTDRTNFNLPSGDFRAGTNSRFLVPSSAQAARTYQLGFRVAF